VPTALGLSAGGTQAPLAFCPGAAGRPAGAWGICDEQYRSVGLDVRTAKFVTVKNPMNYQLAYQGIMEAAHILDTPGPTTPNLRSLAFTRLGRPYFPKDDDIPGLAI